MDNLQRGEELNQLSRLLFNKASSKWYRAILIEILAGTLGCIVAVLELPIEWNTKLAIIGFILLIISYFFKIQYFDLYDSAETMRRQSVLTEALNWPIGKVQFSEWRLKAGTKILKLFKAEARNKEYYATQETPSPKRLLEITIESAFWTRHLYKKLIPYIAVLLVASIILIFITLSITPFPQIPSEQKLKITYFIYLFLPMILSIDIIGWLIKVIKLANNIKSAENDMEKLLESSEIKIEQVMRLVSEYNCQVVSGFPIPNFFFKLSYNEITELWKCR